MLSEEAKLNRQVLTEGSTFSGRGTLQPEPSLGILLPQYSLVSQPNVDGSTGVILSLRFTLPSASDVKDGVILACGKKVFTELGFRSGSLYCQAGNLIVSTSLSDLPLGAPATITVAIIPSAHQRDSTRFRHSLEVFVDDELMGHADSGNSFKWTDGVPTGVITEEVVTMGYRGARTSSTPPAIFTRNLLGVRDAFGLTQEQELISIAQPTYEEDGQETPPVPSTEDPEPAGVAFLPPPPGAVRPPEETPLKKLQRQAAMTAEPHRLSKQDYRGDFDEHHPRAAERESDDDEEEEEGEGILNWFTSLFSI